MGNRAIPRSYWVDRALINQADDPHGGISRWIHGQDYQWQILDISGHEDKLFVRSTEYRRFGFNSMGKAAPPCDWQEASFPSPNNTELSLKTQIEGRFCLWDFHCFYTIGFGFAMCLAADHDLNAIRFELSVTTLLILNYAHIYTTWDRCLLWLHPKWSTPYCVLRTIILFHKLP